MRHRGPLMPPQNFRPVGTLWSVPPQTFAHLAQDKARSQRIFLTARRAL